MTAARVILCAAALASFALTVVAFDQVRPPLDRTEEYKHSSHVFEGTVRSIGYLDEDGKTASKGPRFNLDLTLKVIHKPKDEKKLKKGDVVAIQGRTRDKTGKVDYAVPAAKDDVIAFVKQTKDGKYEALEPKGFEGMAVSLSAGRSAPGPGDTKSKAKPDKKEETKSEKEKNDPKKDKS